jgi:hypothetical protein
MNCEKYQVEVEESRLPESSQVSYLFVYRPKHVVDYRKAVGNRVQSPADRGCIKPFALLEQFQQVISYTFRY